MNGVRVEITEELSNRLSNMAIVCAALVVIIHCRPRFEFDSFGWWIQQLLENGVCAIAVPYFFTASGFFLAGHVGEPGWYRREAQKRVKTLLLPFVLWLSIFFIPDSLWNVWKGQLTWSQILSVPNLLDFYGVSLGELPGLTPLWYLRGLFILVLLSPLLHSFLRFGRMGLVVLFMVYGLVCPGPAGEGLLHDLTLYGILPAAGIFYFTLGMALRERVIAWSVPREALPYIAIAGGLLVFLQPSACCERLWYFQYFGWLSIPFLLLGLWMVIPSNRWPTWLTGSAFAVYILHRFFFQIAKTIVGGNDTVLRYAFIAVFMFSVALAVSVVLHKFLPRVSKVLFGGR